MPGLRADFRFLLPSHPRRAAVLGGLAEWWDDLERVGIEMVSPGQASHADLVVAPRHLARFARASGCSALVVRDGRVRIPARERSCERAFLPLIGVDSPGFVIPLRKPPLARYAIEHGLPARIRAARAWNGLAWWALSAGLVPPGRTTVTVVAPPPTIPFLVAAAVEFGLPPTIDWLLVRGRGGEWTWHQKKGTFLLFERGCTQPGWALKFPRFPGPSRSLLAEEANLRRAVSAGPGIAQHVPEPLGRVCGEGFHASLERAAPGLPLDSFLTTKVGERAKVALIDAVCEWIVELAARTAERTAPEGSQDGRSEGDEAAAIARLERETVDVPSVLLHDDLWPRNVLVYGESFTVIDWGAARRGWPLWDLLGFLINSLPLLRGTGWHHDEQVHLLHDLFAGRSDLSPLLFRWIRRSVERLGLRDDDVARLATLYVLDPRHRPWPRAAFAREWSTAPGLGSTWRAWQA